MSGEGIMPNQGNWAKKSEPVLTLDAWNAAIEAYHESIEFANLDNYPAEQEITLLLQHVFSPVWIDGDTMHTRKLARTLSELREDIDECLGKNMVWNIENMASAIHAAFESAYEAAEAQMSKVATSKRRIRSPSSSGRG